jgi:hypothetical protein
MNNLKRTIIKFSMYFFAFFIGNLILNAVFKDDLNIGTAFSVALGFSVGLAFIGKARHRFVSSFFLLVSTLALFNINP